MGCHFLLQGIFLTQESNPGFLHCRQILYRLSYEGSPLILTEDFGRLGFNPWAGKTPLEEGIATHSSILAWRIP